jgi:hypothetical protein
MQGSLATTQLATLAHSDAALVAFLSPRLFDCRRLARSRRLFFRTFYGLLLARFRISHSPKLARESSYFRSTQIATSGAPSPAPLLVYTQ